VTVAPAGRLVVVGTGIRTTGQLTVEAIAWMKVADVVMHMVSDPVAKELIRRWQPDTNVDLHQYYEVGRPRRATYDDMVAAVVAEVRLGKTVCLAVYGHPGVFARAPNLAILRLRADGFRAEMLPAVSAEDCLFADLGVDPGDGCMSFEATNFLLHDHSADPSVHLLLWQIGVLGDWTHRTNRDVSANLELIVEKLSKWYRRDHKVVVYQASVVLETPPRADRVQLADLPTIRLGAGCTLYIPPGRALRTDNYFADRLERTIRPAAQTGMSNAPVIRR